MDFPIHSIVSPVYVLRTSWMLQLLYIRYSNNTTPQYVYALDRLKNYQIETHLLLLHRIPLHSSEYNFLHRHLHLFSTARLTLTAIKGESIIEIWIIA